MDAVEANIVSDVVAAAAVFVSVLGCAELGAICRRHVFVSAENAACCKLADAGTRHN